MEIEHDSIKRGIRPLASGMPQQLPLQPQKEMEKLGLVAARMERHKEPRMLKTNTMRFYNNPQPKSGDTRYRNFFALWPVACGNETRWLEFVCLEQSYWSGTYDSEWSNERFIDIQHLQ